MSKALKIAAVLLCLCCVLLLRSPVQIATAPYATPTPTVFNTDPYGESILSAAKICQGVYSRYPKGDTLNVVLSEDIMTDLLDALEGNGYSVIDGENKFNMRNPDPMRTFGSELRQNKWTEAVFFTVHTDGHIGMNIVTPTHIKTLSARFTEEPSIYLRTESDLTSISYTDKGWLIYSRDPANVTNAKQFNVSPYTMVRVEPLEIELRELCEKYIQPIGYSENNLFTVNWDSENMSSIDYASLYAMLFGLAHNGETLNWYSAKSYYTQIEDTELFLIPEEEFESVTQQYLAADQTTLRNIPEYSPQRDSYLFLGWQTGYYSVIPRLPTPEVVDAVYHTDGSITMEVDALYTWYGTDCAFTHRVTVLPSSDGSFRYISNSIAESENVLFPKRLLPNLRASAIKQANAE